MTSSQEPEGWLVKGYIHRGPDFSQKLEGWIVHAHKQPGIDVPVTLQLGHINTGNCPHFEPKEEKETP